jgi:hypothetical protein
MTIKMLKAVLDGLPESSMVKITVDGKLYDLEIIGITRTQDLPDLASIQRTQAFHSIREFILFSDKQNLPELEGLVKVKVVYTSIPGREGEP